LPAGDGFAGKNAGPSFEVFADVALLPHKASAWAYFRERLDEIAAACDSVAGDTRASASLKGALNGASAAMSRIASPVSFQPNGLTWANGIKQLFSPMDIAHMAPVPDLGDYQTVKDQTAIWDRVSQKDMPRLPLGPWTDQRIALFKQWMDSGFPA
jgi:hypothetical protein